ncbi:MAG: sigma-54-dependent Fis family transcriptional regulator [Desulfobacterales bacterium]|jgi:two-component system, NtrC family, response regulator HydG|nr:sigma-54-dependent Fis family transcriptional regulator [Desulfobacterales bacterium]MBT7697541.1 sigma-54-dependent Fis family transcriptional regulator [Desulfobacterales bacterium]
MKEKQTVLVVDDDNAHRTMLHTLVGGWGYEIREANDGSVAIEMIQDEPFDIVLMDIRMLKVSGIEALESIKRFNPLIPVIIMTAYSSVETAVDALKKGAYDYLTKPLDFNKLRHTLEKAVEHIRLSEENRILKESLGKHFDKGNIIGQSPAMTRFMETVNLVAPSEATILLTGESGTGKELIAGALHFNSSRREGPFIKINCAAITETLLESELFGHEKGAFTGADKRKDGRFLQAHKGSLLLDEVSEMPLTMQVKLLRVLQEREITRVGGDEVIEVDVRLIAATNKNLQELIKEGKFREDLYYRLNVVTLELPSLNERVEDIPLLAQHFLEIFSKKNKKEIKGFTPRAMDNLIRYSWKGNVRELMNVIERGVVLGRSDYIEEHDLPIVNVASGIDAVESQPAINDGMNFEMSLEDVERKTILQTLESAGGNKSETARRLGITRRTLHKKLKKYGVMP